MFVFMCVYICMYACTCMQLKRSLPGSFKRFSLQAFGSDQQNLTIPVPLK